MGNLPRFRARVPIFALLASIVLVATLYSYPVRGAGENYALTPSPNRIQEISVTGVTLSLSVTNAAIFTTYNFTWTVTDPTGTSTTATNSTSTFFSNAFVLSATYPKSFTGSTTKYVGNYTVRVDETSPNAKTGVAQGWFLVGLTDLPTYERTSVVSIGATGYKAGESVTVNIAHGSSTIVSFPTTTNNGVVSYSWQSSPGTLTGSYTVSLQGAITKKSPMDTQTFTLYPTNITITQLSVTYNSLERTQTEQFQITATYLSGVPVTSGTGQLVVTSPGSSVVYNVTAYSDSSLPVFLANYKVPLSGPTGTWTARIAPYTFNDGYGNGGPITGVIKGFDLKPASLSVSVSVQNKTYATADVIVIVATVRNPDGSSFTSGNVTASPSLSGSGTLIGNVVSLSYVQTQDGWVGSVTVRSDEPSGVWLIHVNASDSYGNSGEGSTFALVSVQPVPSIPLYYFIALAAVLGSGGATALFLRKFNTTDKPFDELYKLTGGKLPLPSALMIRGESGSGTTTLALQLIYRSLKSGTPCGIVTYDAFPSEIQKMMVGSGGDVSSYVKDGSLKFLDCYSSLVGAAESIRDPMDFTEISIQVSSMTGPEKGPWTILLDSFTSIFNSPKANQAINFLRVLGAKVKGSGGLFIMTGTKGSMPEETESTLESTVDGLIDLKLVKRGNSMVRFLTVKKMAGRQISSVETEFEITRAKGITFKEPRINVGALWRK